MKKKSEVIRRMIGYYTGDPRRINHFMKVYGYAKTIGELEGLDWGQQEILELAAITHDIGILVSEEKYNSSSGKYQEIEGPALVQELLTDLEYPEKTVERVAYLVGHHHTYNAIDDIVFQILVEADFLVNIYEEDMKKETMIGLSDKYFKTETGCMFVNNMFTHSGS